MKLEHDYTAKYLKEKEHVDEAINTPLTDIESERLRLINDLLEARLSQYTRTPDAVRQAQLVDKFYPFLRALAERNGAYVRLNIDEEEMTGQIKYSCYDFLMVSGNELRGVKKILAASNELIVGIMDNLLEFTLSFSLFNAEKTADYSKEIAAISDKLRALYPESLDELMETEL